MARKTQRKRRPAARRATKTAHVRARIDPVIKEQAEGILEDLGLNPSTAIGTFYRQIVLRRGLPFAVEVPNARTAAAVEQARLGHELIDGADVRDLLSKLLNKKDLAGLAE